MNLEDINSSSCGSFSINPKKASHHTKSRLCIRNHLSGNSEINEVIEAKAADFKVVMYYVALRSPVDNIIRVQEREQNAGHSVEEEDIIRRHNSSRANLLAHINLFDRIYLFDNSGEDRSRVAIFYNGKLGWLNPKHKHHPFFKDLF